MRPHLRTLPFVLRTSAPLLVMGALLGGRPLAADPPPDAAPPAPAAPAGAVYKNAAVGLTVTGPKGWTLKAASAETVAWKRLAAFTEPGTQVEVVVSQRDRTAGSLDALQAAVQKEWDADRSFSVAGVRAIEPTALRPVGMVQVEASQVRKSAAAGAAAGAAPTQVLWNLLVSYVLTQRYEILVYATGPAVAWPRSRGAVQTLLDTLVLTAAPRGPEGEGAYRNDERGFGVRCPKGYTVVVPPRRDHVVSFVPTSADVPVLDVYLIDWKEDLSKDAERLIAHFQEARGGEASSRVAEVGGQQGLIVTAHVVESGRESTVLLALFKRGEELFRLRASMPRVAEAAGTTVFDDFVKSFAYTASR